MKALLNKLVLENLKHRPIRTLLTVFAIGLQVTLMLTIVGLSRGLLDASKARSSGVGADIMVRPQGTSVIGLSSAPMREALVPFIEKLPHVAIAHGVVMHGIGGFDSMAGIELDKFNRMSGGLTYLSGGPFTKPDEIIIDDYFARQRGLSAGSEVELANQKWKIAGIVEPGKLSRAFVDKKVLQEITANTDRVTVIYVKADSPANTQRVLATLKEKFPDNPIYTMEEFLSQITPDNIPGVNAFIRVVVGLSIVFGFLVVFLAMYTAVLERTREIGILKALGATPPFVLRLLLRETAVLGVLGCLVGILLSFVARSLILTFVPASLPIAIAPDWWWRAALISLAGAVLGAVYPGLKAARQDAVEALAYE